MPSVSICSENVRQFHNFKLAYPFFGQSAPVDVLFGADVFSDIVMPSVPPQPGTPMILLTMFGDVLM